MKSQALKSLIKEAVKEAIQEELKEILLEAVRAPKQTVMETPTYSPTISSPQPVTEDRKAKYRNILGETAQQFSSQHVQQFNPQGAMPGGDLPNGELGMDQIMGLMNSK